MQKIYNMKMIENFNKKTSEQDPETCSMIKSIIEKYGGFQSDGILIFIFDQPLKKLLNNIHKKELPASEFYKEEFQ